MEEKIAKAETKDQSVVGNLTGLALQTKLDAISNFHDLLSKSLKEGVDYGTIVGCGKSKSLLKPGAEKVVTILGLGTEYEFVEKDRDFAHSVIDYIIKCKLVNLNTGLTIAEGMGTANSYESKFMRGGKPDMGLDNTIMKMAMKRALVSAALQVGSLSDIYTQDIDDASDKNEIAPNDSQEAKLEKPITNDQAKRIFAIATSRHYDLVKDILVGHGYGSSKDIKAKDYDSIVSELQSKISGLDAKPEAKKQ